MATTANQGLPYQLLTDAPNGPTLGQQLALALEPKLVMRFSNTADRTTKIPAPTNGMLSWLDDLRRLEVYDSTAAAWVIVGGNVPRARLSRSTNTSIANSSNATLPFTTTDWQTSPALVSGNLLVPTVPGMYSLTAYVLWASGVAGRYQARILDQAGNALAGTADSPTAGVSGVMTVTTTVNVRAAQIGTTAAQFAVNVFQNTGGAVNVTNAYFEIGYRCPAI